jgi:hypothetical protein
MCMRWHFSQWAVRLACLEMSHGSRSMGPMYNDATLESLRLCCSKDAPWMDLLGNELGIMTGRF